MEYTTSIPRCECRCKRNEHDVITKTSTKRWLFAWNSVCHIYLGLTKWWWQSKSQLVCLSVSRLPATKTWMRKHVECAHECWAVHAALLYRIRVVFAGENQILPKRIMTKVCAVSNFHDAEELCTHTHTYTHSAHNRSKGTYAISFIVSLFHFTRTRWHFVHQHTF